jgi:hypothetical protein
MTREKANDLKSKLKYTFLMQFLNAFEKVSIRRDLNEHALN